jgi:hypothetical protein
LFLAVSRIGEWDLDFENFLWEVLNHHVKSGGIAKV